MQDSSFMMNPRRRCAKFQINHYMILIMSVITVYLVHNYWITKHRMQGYSRKQEGSQKLAASNITKKNSLHSNKQTVYIQRDGQGYSCCASFTEEQMNQFEKLWTAHPENAGIHFTLLYRGVEVDIGRLSSKEIKTEAGLGAGDLLLCIPVPADVDRLLTKDKSYEDFLESMDKNILYYENYMVQAASKVKDIPTLVGFTSNDEKNLLATYLEASWAVKHQPLPHVEIGSYHGRSGALTAHFADLMGFSKYNASKAYMLSPKFEPDIDLEFNKTVKALGVEQHVRWFDGTNGEVPWTFGPVKSIFEDSKHDFASVSQSHVLIYRYLVEGGLVAFHDMRCADGHMHAYGIGLRWVFNHLIESGNNWKEVVFPFKESRACECAKERPNIRKGCNYVRVLQRRVKQPAPIGVRVVVEGNPEGTTFRGELVRFRQHHELMSFTGYQDLFEG